MTSQGTLKSFNHGKGWGFLVCEGVDVFFHASGVVGRPPKEGDVLTFDLKPSPSKPGQMVAENVKGGTAGGSYEGVVKNYSILNGFGFIDCADGESIFAHHSELMGGVLMPGDKVCFDVDVSPKDPSKTVAKNIVGGSGPPGRKGKDMAVKGLGKDKDYFCKGGKWEDVWKGGKGKGWGPYDGGKGWDSKGKGSDSWDGGKGKGWDSWSGDSWSGGGGGGSGMMDMMWNMMSTMMSGGKGQGQGKGW